MKPKVGQILYRVVYYDYGEWIQTWKVERLTLKGFWLVSTYDKCWTRHMWRSHRCRDLHVTEQLAREAFDGQETP